MLVPVVDIREMWMSVREPLMPVRMGMRLLAVPRKVVLMLVMRVVNMRVGMRYWLVRVLVAVFFSQVQPDTHHHQGGGWPE